MLQAAGAQQAAAAAQAAIATAPSSSATTAAHPNISMATVASGSNTVSTSLPITVTSASL